MERESESRTAPILKRSLVLRKVNPLWGILDRADFKRWLFRVEVAVPHPECNVHESNQRRHFDQRAHHADERFPGIQAEDSNSLIFRVYDWSGKGENVSLAIPPGATGAILTNLMEQQEGQPLEAKSGHVTFPVHPFEIVSVRVDYPEGAASLPR